MAKRIRMIVVMEYEPQRDWYNDSPVEWEGDVEGNHIEAIARYDAELIMDGELSAPQDWSEDNTVQVVSAFVVDDETSLETMVTSLAKGQQ